MKWYDTLKATGPFSWISWIISAFNKNDKTFSKIGEGVNSAFNKFTGAGLTGAEQEANRFTQGMAEQAHQWDIENYKNRHQWEVEGMQSAGLNPALMYGGSTGTGSVPSSPAGSSVSPTSGFNPIDAILQLALAKSQIENVNADTEQKKQDTAKSAAETIRIESLTPSEIEKYASEIARNNKEVDYLSAQTDLALANVVSAESDAAFRDRFNEVNLQLAELNKLKTTSETSRNYEEIKRMEQECKNMVQEIAESYSRIAVNKANSGYLSQLEKNALVENDIIQWNSRSAKYEAKIKEFTSEHVDDELVWNRVAAGFGMAKDLGVGVGAAVAGFRGFGSAAPTVQSSAPILYNANGNPMSTIKYPTHR